MTSFKIALRNIRKSSRDYFVYFMTLTLSIAIFYAFNTFQKQTTLLELSEMQQVMMKSTEMVIIVFSFIVAFIFALLILYANQFLIKRRKKEFGTYILLGMSKKQVGRIIFLETVLVAIFSLIVGLILGLMFSQLAVFVTARILSVNVDFEFIFSTRALLISVPTYALMFLFSAFLNQHSIRKLELIDLLYAEKKNENMLKMKGVFSIMVFVLSVIMIAYAYWKALEPFELLYSFGKIMFSGIAGTYLLFASVSVFLLKLMQKIPQHYFKGLNPFVFRQINSKIKSSYKSMATVSLLLLFSIVPLLGASNVNKVIRERTENLAPYQVSIFRYGEAFQENVLEKVKSFDENYEILTVYRSEETLATLSDFLEFVNEDFKPNEVPVYLMSVSEYNQVLVKHHQKPLSLSRDEVYFYHMNDGMQNIQVSPFRIDTKHDYAGKQFDFDGKRFKMASIQNSQTVNFRNTSDNSPILIMNDHALGDISNKELDYQVINSDMSDQRIVELQASMGETGETYTFLQDRTSILDAMTGMQMLFAYIAFYLGTVFLLSSSLVLALQQLSETDDNIERYQILSQLGVSTQMLQQTLRKQIRIYFSVPMLVALFHSYFGLKAFGMNFERLGFAEITFRKSVPVLSLILLFYFLYYRFTYHESKMILKRSTDA